MAYDGSVIIAVDADAKKFDKALNETQKQVKKLADEQKKQSAASGDAVKKASQAGADAVVKNAGQTGEAVKKACEESEQASKESTDAIVQNAEQASGSFDGLKNAGKAALGALTTAAAAAGAALAGIGAYAVKVGSDFEAGMSKVQAISGATGEDLEALKAKAKEMGATTKFSATQSAEALQYMAMAGWKTEQMTAGLPGIMNLAAASGESLASVSDIVTDALTAFGLKAEDSAHFADVLAKASSNSNTNVAMMGETFKYAAPVAGALGYSIEDVAVATGLMANSGIKAEMAGTALRGMLTNLAKPTRMTSKYIDGLGLSLTDAGGQMKPLSGLIDELRDKFAALTEEQKAEYAAGIAGKEAMSGLLAIVNASEADYQKLTAAIADANGAAKQQADIMNDNLQGAMTLLGSNLEGVGIQIYDSLEKPLKEAVRSANDSVTTIGNSLKSGQLKASMETLGKALGKLIESAARLAAQVLPKLIGGFATLVQHGDQVAAALKVAAAGFVTFKTAAVLDKVIKSVRAASAAVAAYTAAQSLATGAQAASAASLTVYQAIIGVLTGQLGAAATAQGILNAAMTACPAVAIGMAVAALMGGLALLAAATRDATSAEYQRVEAAKQALAASEETRRAVEQEAAARREQEDAQRQAIDRSLSEIAVTESQIAELDRLTDENGRVTKGYEARADFLADQINKVIPDAIRKNKDEAGSYYLIAEAIDDMLARKKAEAVLSAIEPQYAEAVSKLVGAEKERAQVARELSDAQDRLTQSQQRLEAMRQSGNWEYSAEYLKEQEACAALEGTVANLSEAYRVQDETLNGYYDTINRYESVATSMTQGTDAMNEAVSGVQYAFRRATDASLAELTRQRDEISAIYTDIKDRASRGVIEVSDATLLEWQTMLERANSEIKTGSDALMDSWQGSLRAGQPDVEAAAQLIAAGLLAKTDVTAEVARCGDAAADAWRQSIAKGEPDITAATQTIAAGILTNADVSSQMHETGRQLALGLASGIEAEQSRALTASANLAMNTVSAAMRAAQIHSPSRLMRDKVGKMLPAGLALGIEDGAPAVLEAVTALSEAAIACARDEAKSYKEIGSQYIENLTFGVESMRDKSIYAIEQAVKADTAAYKAQIDAQTETLVAAKKKQRDAANKARKEGLQKEIDQIKSDASDKKKAYEDAGRQATEAYKSALSEGFADALNLVKSRVSALTGEFQQAHDDLTRQQEAMQSKLSGFGDLFTMDKSGDLSLGKIEQNIEAVRRYDQALTRLAERGVSDEFMQKVTALGVEEGTKFAEKLVGLSRDGFSAYMEAWDEQQRLSKEVASRFYADQLETLDRDFQGKLNGVLAGVPQTMASLGAESLQGWAKGLTAQMDGASQDVQSMLSGLIAAFGKAGQASPVTDSGQAVGMAFADGIARQIPLAVSAAQTMAQAVAAALGNSLANTEGADGAQENGVQTVQAYAGGIAAQLGQVAQAAQGTADTFSGTVLQALPQVQKAGDHVMGALTDAVAARQGAVRSSAEQTVKSFCSAVSARYGQFRQTGLYAMQGLETGLREGGQSAINTAAWIADSIISEMQRALDIHSPSRKMARLVGKPAAQGVAVGFEQEMANVYRQVSRTLNGELSRLSADVHIGADRAAAGSSPAPVQTILQREHIENTPKLVMSGDAAGLMRYLYPHWENEYKRRGKSLRKGSV